MLLLNRITLNLAVLCALAHAMWLFSLSWDGRPQGLEPMSLATKAIAFAVVVAMGSFASLMVGTAIGREVPPIRLWMALAVLSVLSVLTYTALFAAIGLHGFDQETGLSFARDTSYHEALFFSLATWTTLGYGDPMPPPGAELLAASEAVLGYIVFGLLVGVTTALMLE